MTPLRFAVQLASEIARGVRLGMAHSFAPPRADRRWAPGEFFRDMPACRTPDVPC